MKARNRFPADASKNASRRSIRLSDRPMPPNYYKGNIRNVSNVKPERGRRNGLGRLDNVNECYWMPRRWNRANRRFVEAAGSGTLASNFQSQNASALADPMYFNERRERRAGEVEGRWKRRRSRRRRRPSASLPRARACLLLVWGHFPGGYSDIAACSAHP